MYIKTQTHTHTHTNTVRPILRYTSRQKKQAAEATTSFQFVHFFDFVVVSAFLLETQSSVCHSPLRTSCSQLRGLVIYNTRLLCSLLLLLLCIRWEAHKQVRRKKNSFLSIFLCCCCCCFCCCFMTLVVDVVQKKSLIHIK